MFKRRDVSFYKPMPYENRQVLSRSIILSSKKLPDITDS